MHRPDASSAEVLATHLPQSYAAADRARVIAHCVFDQPGPRTSCQVCREMWPCETYQSAAASVGRSPVLARIPAPWRIEAWEDGQIVDEIVVEAADAERYAGILSRRWPGFQVTINGRRYEHAADNWDAVA